MTIKSCNCSVSHNMERVQSDLFNDAFLIQFMGCCPWQLPALDVIEGALRSAHACIRQLTVVPSAASPEGKQFCSVCAPQLQSGNSKSGLHAQTSGSVAEPAAPEDLRQKNLKAWSSARPPPDPRHSTSSGKCDPVAAHTEQR